MRFRAIAALIVPIVVLVACSLPTDESVTPIDRDVLGAAIANTTTTSTSTTTTTTVPTTDPGGTVGGSVPDEPTTTSTQVPTATSRVDLYYTIGFSDEIARLTRELREDPSIQEVVAQLEAPLEDVRGFGLRTAVPRGMVVTTTIERGTATIELDSDVVDGMTDENLGRAIAQIVLTVTSFRPANSGGIGLVRFEVDGEGLAVFVPARGGSSEPGEELAFEDFAPLIAGPTGPTTIAPPGATTTTPSTTPITTQA